MYGETFQPLSCPQNILEGITLFPTDVQFHKEKLSIVINFIYTIIISYNNLSSLLYPSVELLSVITI